MQAGCVQQTDNMRREQGRHKLAQTFGAAHRAIGGIRSKQGRKGQQQITRHEREQRARVVKITEYVPVQSCFKLYTTHLRQRKFIRNLIACAAQPSQSIHFFTRAHKPDSSAPFRTLIEYLDSFKDMSSHRTLIRSMHKDADEYKAKMCAVAYQRYNVQIRNVLSGKDEFSDTGMCSTALKKSYKAGFVGNQNSLYQKCRSVNDRSTFNSAFNRTFNHTFMSTSCYVQTVGVEMMIP
jgi:hypothetical protein